MILYAYTYFVKDKSPQKKNRETSEQEGGTVFAMNEEFLIDVLKNKDSILWEIEENIKTILRSIQQEADEVEEIRTFYLPHPTAQLGKASRTAGRVRDLSDLYDSFEKSRQRRNKESQHLLNGLIRQREEVEHVWKCFLVLPHEPQRLLKMYYAEGRKLEDVAQELKVSVKTVFNRRNAALKLLKESCESGLSPDVLLRTGWKAKQCKGNG